MIRRSETPPLHPGEQPPHLPLLPPRLLKRHSAFIGSDTRFRAAARLLQSLCRDDIGIGIGAHLSISGTKSRRVHLGSRLPDAAAEAGLNFVSTEVHRLVRRALVLREEGAMIDEDRLYANMLSSMPLAFNVLGPMALDLGLASAVWRLLLPNVVDTVTAIGFEHSPGRGRPEFLDDGTAFDAALQVITPDDKPGMIFIEFKYSEGMSGPAATHRPRYDAASRQVRLYHDPDSPALRSVALEQLWREHMMAQLAVDLDRTPKAHLVAICPRLNRQVGAAFTAYAAELADPEPEDVDRVGFSALTLESIVAAMAEAGAADLADLLQHRYLDFGRILDLALAEADNLAPPPPAKPTASSRRQAAGEIATPAALAEPAPGRRISRPRRSRESPPGRRSRRSGAGAAASSRTSATAGGGR